MLCPVRKPSKQAAVAVFVSALASLLAAGSRGEDTEAARVALVWKTPPEGGCATSEQIRGEVGRLSETSLVASGQHFEVEALALVHEGSWVASVALRDERGRILGGREVSGPYVSCRELDVPVALVVSTLLDGLRQQRTPAAPAPAVVPTDPDSQRRHAIGIGAFVTGAVGLAPRLTLGAGAVVELPLAWPLLFSASAYLPGREVDTEGRGVRLLSVLFGMATCPRLVGHRHALRLCASAQAGAALAKGVGLTESRQTAAPLVLLGLEPQLVLGLTPSWALQLSLAGYWLPIRARFHWKIEGSDDGTAEAEPLALILRIGVIDFLR